MQQPMTFEAAAQLGRWTAAALERVRRRRCSRENLEALFASEAAAPRGEGALAAVARACAACGDRETREAFRELVLHVELRARPMLEEPDTRLYAGGLLRLAQQWRCWERLVQTWRPTTGFAPRQFAHLARHLLARYPVPAFMDSALLAPVSEAMALWFRHLGSGRSIRTAPGLTVPLTKRAAYHVLGAPVDYTVVQAIRWGQVLGAGGDAPLARAVAGTWLGRQFGSEADELFWRSALGWLVSHAPDPVEVGPVLDYLQHRRRLDRGFAMKGRSLRAVLRLVDQWHERANAGGGLPYQEFAPSGLRSGRWERGDPPRVWIVEEIRDSRDLEAEGAEMRHCVAMYGDAVADGTSSIWSLKVERAGRRERAVTVEVWNEARTLGQCRGKYNRYPTEEEMRVLAAWARENNLSLSGSAWGEL